MSSTTSCFLQGHRASADELLALTSKEIEHLEEENRMLKKKVATLEAEAKNGPEAMANTSQALDSSSLQEEPPQSTDSDARSVKEEPREEEKANPEIPSKFSEKENLLANKLLTHYFPFSIDSRLELEVFFPALHFITFFGYLHNLMI